MKASFRRSRQDNEKEGGRPGLLLGRRNLNKFAVWFFVGMIFALAGRSNRLRSPKQRAGDLIKGAAGLRTSADTALDTPEEGLVKPILRSYFDDLRTLAKDGRCGGIEPHINSADSFSDQNSIHAAFAYFDECEAKTNDKIRPDPKD